MSAAEAVDRELKKRNESTDPNIVAQDVEGIAKVLVRHYGDQAPEVLERAAQVARDTVATWSGRSA